jgi:hypothetical protein
MTRALDPVVPDALRAVLESDDLAGSEGFTLQLLSVRADGWPHAALLSAGEVVVVDDDRLRLAIWPGSTTAANLAARPQATLAAVLAPTSYLVRVRLAPLGALETPLGGRLAAFEATVEAAAADEAPYAVLEGGVSFRLTAPESTLPRWAQTRSALQEARG